jgi:DNA-binding winged helix-turn-helix (wHTH) protein/TolB-like protein
MAAPYRFGPYEFQPDTGELRRAGRVVRLEPQPARVLALLLARPGELVTREEIRRELWGDDVHVEVDRGIAYALNQVRTALGDSASEPRWVETLPRRGYRFVAPVDGEGVAGGRAAREGPEAGGGAAPGAAGGHEVEEGPATRGRRPPVAEKGGWAAAAGRGRPAAFALAVLAVAGAAWLLVARPWAVPARVLVAVAAFDNETGEARHDALAARMADAVVARLVAAEPRRLGVIGNQAVLRLPRGERDLAAIRRETGAGFVILGQLQPDEGGLRVIAHLIALDDGTHLWANRFAGAPGDLAGLEAAVADAVAAAVPAHLLPVARP